MFVELIFYSSLLIPDSKPRLKFSSVHLEPMVGGRGGGVSFFLSPASGNDGVKRAAENIFYYFYYYFESILVSSVFELIIWLTGNIQAHWVPTMMLNIFASFILFNPPNNLTSHNSEAPGVQKNCYLSKKNHMHKKRRDCIWAKICLPQKNHFFPLPHYIIQLSLLSSI